MRYKKITDSRELAKYYIDSLAKTRDYYMVLPSCQLKRTQLFFDATKLLKKLAQ
jgi:hypothetical protein